jgi:hypothetical protein
MPKTLIFGQINPLKQYLKNIHCKWKNKKRKTDDRHVSEFVQHRQRKIACRA